MPLITNDELRNRVRTTITRQCPYNASKTQKLENIQSFDALSRDGLEVGEQERRLLLYETAAGEKLYFQYPGTESAREGTRAFPLDARPVLRLADGTFAPDMDFKRIWDIIDIIGQTHRADIDVLATLFLRIAYMIGYQHNDRNYTCEKIDIASGDILETTQIPFAWNSLCIDADVLETLGDRFGTFEGVSLEAFLYYNDLLAQNEDCKYHYLKGDNWDICTGRINNCLSHLTVISHIRGHIGISKLIDSFQRTGVAPLPQSRLSEACDDLIQRR